MATAAISLLCDPCKECEEEQVPVAFCLECRELYCKTCLNCHFKTTVTMSHVYVYLTGDESGEICHCDLCNAENSIANSLCSHCRQIYCTACTNRHRKLKATKNHVIVEIISDKSVAISSELAACSINFNVTYSGAQVPLDKNEHKNQQGDTAVNKRKVGMSVPDDIKSTHRSEPIHSESSARQSDMKQTSLSGSFHSTFSVRVPSDKKQAEVNRMISMPDGRICVVDRGDYKMKLYTDDYVLCDEVCFVPECTAVACVDDDTVAVARARDIERYSVKGNKITQIGRPLHIDGAVYDIAYRHGEFIIRYNKDNTDFTCYGSKHIVKQDRKLLLSDNMYYDPVTDCVMLSNFLEHNITCYTLDGDVKWRNMLEGGPTGIVVVHDIVLVTDYGNQTIRQITMDGRLLSTPVMTRDHGIAFPKAIAYQSKQNRLLVTKACDDKVKVFNLLH